MISKSSVFSWMTVADWVLIVILVSASFMGIYGLYFWDQWFLSGESEFYAFVNVGNDTVETIRLDENDEYHQIYIAFSDDNVATLEIYQGKIRVRDDSNHICPLEYCMNVGWIERPGQVIVCVPNKMVITIKNLGNGEYQDLDAVIY